MREKYAARTSEAAVSMPLLSLRRHFQAHSTLAGGN